MTAVVNFFKKLGDNVADAFKKLPNAFYVLIHPFEGYYDLKHDPRKKSVNTAILIYILLAFSAVFKRQLTGYLFTSVSEQLNLNVLIEIGVAVLPYILWTIANWCFSSLMDGDGKFSDIFVATAVGTLPIIISNFISVPFRDGIELSRMEYLSFLFLKYSRCKAIFSSDKNSFIVKTSHMLYAIICASFL